MKTLLKRLTQAPSTPAPQADTSEPHPNFWMYA